MKTLMMSLLLLGATLQAADAGALYKKCAACHGAAGEKQALGKSKVIAELSPEQIETALNGYKSGTYGGSMKAVMKGQAATLDEAQIKAIAAYIGTKSK